MGQPSLSRLLFKLRLPLSLRNDLTTGTRSFLERVRMSPIKNYLRLCQININVFHSVPNIHLYDSPLSTPLSTTAKRRLPKLTESFHLSFQ